MTEWAYNQQFKSSEAARQRNRREQRLSELSLNKGADECRFNIDQINKEQRIIEKELERIRLGVHKSPANSSLLGPEKKFHHPHFHIFKLKDSEKHNNKTHEKGKHPTNTHVKDIPNLKEEEDIDAFMIIEYLGGLKKGLSADNAVRGRQLNQDKFTDIKRTQSKSMIDINKINSNQPELSLNETLLSRNGKVDLKTTGEVHQSLNDQSVPVESNRVNLDTLTNGDMTSIQSDTSRRLPKANSVGNMASSSDESFRRKKSVTLAPDVPPSKIFDNNDYSAKQEKGKISDETPRRKTFDQASLNPDCTVRTVYNLPPFETAYAEAKKARYIRTCQPLERDRELTPTEIFDKTSK